MSNYPSTKRIPLCRDHRADAIVDSDDFARLSVWNWGIGTNGYACRQVREGGKKTVIYLHRLVAGAVSGDEVDHINGDRLDNRKVNLRLCNHAQNNMNRGPSAANTTGVVGVCYFKRTGKWLAYIGSKSSREYLGYFPTKEEAASARAAAEQRIFGEFRHQT